MRMERGGCSREVPAARFLQGGCTLDPQSTRLWVAGLDMNYLFVTANSAWGGVRSVATTCAAYDVRSGTFYGNNSRDVEIV